MTKYLTNWKTTLPGIVLVAVAALETLLAIEVPGFDMSLTAAITLAAGLLFARDV